MKQFFREHQKLFVITSYSIHYTKLYEQKLAIARALYNDADLIIFDEPTSAIDPISEMKIYQKLIDICQDKTAIFISHRLGWAKSVDRIYVLESGIIAEEGNHEQLIANNGLYSDMFNLQSSWYK